MGAIAKGWSLLVLPLYLLHFLFSYAAVKLFPLGVAQLVFAGLDGVVSAAMALAAALLDRQAPLRPVEELGAGMLGDIGVDPVAFGGIAKVRGSDGECGDRAVQGHASLPRSRSTTMSVRPH